MIRDALKEALLDLRGQLRGRKASAYILKIEEANEDAKAGRKASSEDEDEDDKPKRESKRPGASAVTEKVSEGMDELRKEMKGFMSKKKSSSSGRIMMPIPNNITSRGSKAVEAQAAKAKGKEK